MAGDWLMLSSNSQICSQLTVLKHNTSNIWHWLKIKHRYWKFFHFILMHFSMTIFWFFLTSCLSFFNDSFLCCLYFFSVPGFLFQLPVSSTHLRAKPLTAREPREFGFDLLVLWDLHFWDFCHHLKAQRWKEPGL